MKRERAFVENRRKNILDAIIENPKIRVEQLAERFSVSAITIRRDLQYLEDHKKTDPFLRRSSAYGAGIPAGGTR